MVQLKFDDIYTQFAPQVFRVCMGYINDTELARDLTQETFISVWQNLPSFRKEAKISTWIFRIATNNCLRQLERSAKRVTIADLPFDLPAPHAETQEEKLAFLYSCIAELEETERIIIALVLEDQPQAEIAAIMGITHANIRVKIHRIKDKLAIKFKAHGRFE